MRGSVLLTSSLATVSFYSVSLSWYFRVPIDSCLLEAGRSGLLFDASISKLENSSK